jgi:hypothetical protein
MFITVIVILIYYRHKFTDPIIDYLRLNNFTPLLLGKSIKSLLAKTLLHCMSATAVELVRKDK